MLLLRAFCDLNNFKTERIQQILSFILQESLKGMTSSQFSGILDRLTKFTSQNLKKLIAHMNLDSFFANVDKVAVRLSFYFN